MLAVYVSSIVSLIQEVLIPAEGPGDKWNKMLKWYSCILLKNNLITRAGFPKKYIAIFNQMLRSLVKKIHIDVCLPPLLVDAFQPPVATVGVKVEVALLFTCS